MSDADLLEQLGLVLDDGTRRAPAPERLAGLAAQVEARRRLASSRRVSKRSRRWAVVVSVAAALLVGAVVGHQPPGPVRDLGHAVAPNWVESSELHEARARLDDLGRALATGDAEGVCAADRGMLDLVGRLSDAEKDKIVPVAHEVHERAVTFLAGLPC